MSNLDISINLHCNARTQVRSDVIVTTTGSHPLLELYGLGYSSCSIFLTAAVAQAMHAALERLYPALAAAPAASDDGDVVVRYAEEHAGELAQEPANAALDAAVAEVLDSENAGKFGSGSMGEGQSTPANPLPPATSVAATMAQYNILAVDMVWKAMGLKP